MCRIGEDQMADTGLQRVAFFLLLGLIVYVAASGGGV
jgi:hypothetical protein